MTEHESLNRAITEAIVIVPYDPAWPAGFEAERRRLLLLAPGVFLGIEHIGSTAVPELAAKPIVDIMAAVPSMEAADRLLAVLCQNGYATSAEFNATLRDRRWLMRQFNGRRTHHLHLVLPGGRYWNEARWFRDLLRRDVVVARRYAELKQKLADSRCGDREAYSEAKTAFIAEVLCETC